MVVSYEVNGLCMANLTANAIPDQGCLNMGINMSGLPTTLGNGAGNAKLYSVELIIDHTYNADLDITLTSPAGNTRNLVRDKGGDGDDMGNPNNCPTSVLLLVDGANATYPNNSNLTGTYAPEELLSGFTGDPNGRWILNVCDDANLDQGNLRFVRLTFCTMPTITASGSNSPVCSSGTLNLSATATGTAPLTYTWTGTGTFSPNANSSTPSVTGAATGNYNIVVSNVCGSTNVNVPVTVVPVPTTATVGSNQTVCEFGTSAGLGGNTPVNGTGSWGIVSGGTGTFSNVSTPNATFTHTGGAGPVVLRWSITNAPCAASTADVSIGISIPPSTAAAGGDQSTCVVDAVTLAATSPAIGTGAWSVVSGPSTSNAQFSNTASPSSTFLAAGGGGAYTLRWTVSNAPCTATTDDVLITVSEACTYYSRGNGQLTDAIWSTSPTGAAGAAVWGTTSDMVVQNGNTITNNSAQNVGSITVDNGGAMVLNGFNLTANGASVTANGTITANDNSTLTIAGSGTKTISLAAATSFWNLTCNASNGTTLTGSASIRNTLLLSDGAFDCTGNPVILESTATRTGRLGPVAATASYTGQLTANRYIPAGATNWRMMGSPVSGQTVNNWKDDFYTAGFPGSHSPNFASPVGSGILWPSIRWYDETNTGAGVNDGLIGVSSTGQSLTAGQGFAAWCGTGYSTTTAFTVDMTGAPHIASTPISLPMSYTNTGNASTDGWNMVCNPLPSPIAFNQISRGSDVDDYVTYFNPVQGNLATWDISNNLGVNGGTNTIQSSQAFWLKANGPLVATSVEEADKVESNTGGFFGGEQVQTATAVRLRIESAINQFSDETVVIFSSGEPAINGEDVPKFVFAHPDAPQISTQGAGGESIAINAYGPYSVDISIPVLVNVAINGNYAIVVTGLDAVGLTCMRLEDLATNTVTPLVEGATYTFAALANDDPNVARFVLRASAPVQLVATDATCNGRDDGAAVVNISNGPVDIIWTDADGVTLLEQNNVMPGTSELNALEAGEYGISISGDATCNTLTAVFVIEEPAALEAEAITEPSSCPATADGTIDLHVLGGAAPYTFVWSNESTSEDQEVVAGTYSVVITDANGCTFAPQEYVVGAGEGPDAGISVESITVIVGEEVHFAPNTLDGVSNTWDFGDGAVSTQLEGLHTYNVPGTYTVTLTVDDGDCTSTASLVIDVQTTTGLSTIVGQTLNAWVSGDQIVVDHNFGTTDPVIIRVIGTGGQLVQEHRVANASARISLPTSDLASGIWMVRVSSGTHMRTFALPIVH